MPLGQYYAFGFFIFLESDAQYEGRAFSITFGPRRTVGHPLPERSVAWHRRPEAQPTNAFSQPSIKCSAAPPSFRLCCLNCGQRFDLITTRSVVVGSWEGPPNIWLTVARKCICRLRVRMLLNGAVDHPSTAGVQIPSIEITLKQKSTRCPQLMKLSLCKYWTTNFYCL